MDWEGAEAVEEIKPTITIPKRQNKPPQTNGERKNGATESKHVAIPSSESEGDADSEDDYMSEAARSTMKGKVCCHARWIVIVLLIILILLAPYCSAIFV